MKAQNYKSNFRFNKDIEIGSPDAETDDLLMHAYVENAALKSLLNFKNQKSIIIGRTGSGKSALIRYIENNEEHVLRIEPEAMSLKYLTNSNILRYFNELQINLTFFYKLLWKHVFIIELLKMYFGQNSGKKDNIFTQLMSKIESKNKKKERALEYMRKWSNDFWQYTEYRIKELVQKVENNFSAEVGLPIESSPARFKINKSMDSEQLADIKYKAEKVINDCQAEEIFEIIKILKEEFFNESFSKKFFIVIDDLDKEWINSEFRYNLIAAMIEVIKEFQSFNGVKVIIALRDNLYQLVFAGFKNQGGQREKFRPLYVNLEWTQDELLELVNKRLNVISNSGIKVLDAFQQKRKSGIDGFQYMIDRTFLRPRDVISFVNHAIENANNKAYFSLDIIKKAEIYYSRDRLQAIEDEWGENFGDIHEIFNFLIGRHNGFKVNNISEDDFAHIYLSDNSKSKFKGELLENVIKWQTDEIKFTVFFRKIVFILYYMGIIGIKRGPTYPLQFFYESNANITINDITSNSKLYVHKAFYSVLKINSKELESNY